MIAKEYLSQIRLMDIKINNKLKELVNLKEMSMALGGCSFEERVQTSKETGDTIGISIAKIIDLQHEINQDVDILVDLKADIIKAIDSINIDDCIDLLYKRYIFYSRWEQIAVDMNYSIRQIHNIHGIALREINKTLH